MKNLGVVVIHHKNFPRILETVEALRREGCFDANILVVDNSEAPDLFARLTAALPATINTTSIANEGYGAAANHGIAVLRERDPGLEFVLISTHEALPEPGAVGQLLMAIESDDRLGVVGPTLVHEVDGQRRVWSKGGYLTAALHEPRHVGAGDASPEAEAEGADVGVTRRSWVDGAFCLYRTAVFEALAFRTDFFLYFEETDLHARMVRQGYEIACVTAAVVEQQSDGIPPRLLGRNLQLFESAHGRWYHRAFTVPAIAARRAARKALRRDGPPHEVRLILQGWWEAVR
jgi:N-acetylglucosaminyl-diphospho-decaprenol L-rhamnosyltransferase